MIFKKSDIHFAADDTHQFLPSLIAVMAFLATLLLCVCLAINGWIVARSSDYIQSFTVNIPANVNDLPGKVSKLQQQLRALPAVADVEELPVSDIKSMLAPWLGSGDVLDGLPLPRVLNVTLHDAESSKLDIAALQKSLGEIAPGTEIDAHERWVAAFSDFSGMAQGLMMIVASLILAAMAAMIAFASRASLHLHARTVHLLHSMGAEDDYIVRQFQREASLLVLPGAWVGCAMAGLVYLGCGLYIRSMSVALLPALNFSWGHLWLLLLLPVACAMAAWGVSSLSVRSQLRAVL